MRKGNNQFNHILANSPERIRNTKAYQQQIEQRKAEITLKYEARLQLEKNVLKRVQLLLRKRIELNRAIRQLTSPGNLYLAFPV